MTWLQILAQAGVIATFLGVGIAVAAYFNGKHVKEGVSKIEQINEKLGEILVGIARTLAEMEKNAEQRHQEFREFMKQCEQRHRELMEIAEQRHRELMETAEQRHRELMETAEQRHREMMEIAEQRHREVMQQHQDIVELLKRGFGGSAGGAAATA
jgi:Skp family chaperone for outer membrane proteins